MQKMLQSSVSMVTCSIERRQIWSNARHGITALYYSRTQCLAELSSTGKRSTSATCQQKRRKTSFQTRRAAQHDYRHPDYPRHAVASRGTSPRKSSPFAARRCGPLPKSRSNSSKPSRTRPSLRSRTCACSRRSRSATQNCAKPWSIRRQRPRCSASSAARPPRCSRSSTPSSRARPGFVGLMT